MIFYLPRIICELRINHENEKKTSALLSLLVVDTQIFCGAATHIYSHIDVSLKFGKEKHTQNAQ